MTKTKVDHSNDISKLGKKIIVRDALAQRVKKGDSINLIVYNSAPTKEGFAEVKKVEMPESKPIWLNSFVYMISVLLCLSWL